MYRNDANEKVAHGTVGPNSHVNRWINEVKSLPEERDR